MVESTSRQGVISYRRLPFTFMQFGMQSLNHKVYQFLWLMFLECGPNYHVIRHKLYMTRAFCTDRGLEQHIVDVGDVLPQFLWSLGCRWPEIRVETWLFPRAFHTAGWHHLLDTIIQKVLQQIEGFPRWLQRLKDLTGFLRDASYRGVLILEAEAAGDDGGAMKKVPTRFAAWRWGTLFMVLTWFVGSYGLLRRHWQRGLFRVARAASAATSCRETIMDKRWWMQTCVIYDLVHATHRLRRWGSGCACHPEERAARPKSQVCQLAGRTLPYALDRLNGFLADCLVQANQGPNENDYCAGLELPFDLGLERKAAWLHLKSLSWEYLKWLGALPHFSRRRDRLRVCRSAVTYTGRQRKKTDTGPCARTSTPMASSSRTRSSTFVARVSARGCLTSWRPLSTLCWQRTGVKLHTQRWAARLTERRPASARGERAQRGSKTTFGCSPRTGLRRSACSKRNGFA